MYSAYKLNKQGDNIQPWCTPFAIWNQSVIPCPVLTVASWPAYRFLKRQIRWSGIPISFRIFHILMVNVSELVRPALHPPNIHTRKSSWTWLESNTQPCSFNSFWINDRESQMSCQQYSASLLHVSGQFTLPVSKTTTPHHFITPETCRTMSIYFTLTEKIEEIIGELNRLTVPKSSNALCPFLGDSPLTQSSLPTVD